MLQQEDEGGTRIVVLRTRLPLSDADNKDYDLWSGGNSLVNNASQVLITANLRVTGSEAMPGPNQAPALLWPVQYNRLSM